MIRPLFFKARGYLNYKWEAQNAYDLHSPFLYDLYRKVIKSGDPVESKRLKQIRKRISKENETLSFVDPKTGIRKHTRTKRLSRQISSSHKFAWFLVRLVNHLGYQTVLETGTGLGVTTSYLAAASHAKTIITQEGSPKLAERARNTFDKLGLNNIHIIEGLVQQQFPKVLKTYHPELVFLDADHRRKTIEFYLDQIKDFPSTKCIIIHDIYWSGDMYKKWVNIIRDRQYTLTLDLFQAGIIFPGYPMEKQHFSLKF